MSVPLSEEAARPQPQLEQALGNLHGLSRRLPRADVAQRLLAVEQMARDAVPAMGREIAGAAFLSAFLRRAHLESMLERELPRLDALDRFVSTGPRSELRVFPRGLVCHWIAGNVPLLGVFSWILSAVLGNQNLLRISSRGSDFITPLVHRLALVSEAGAEMAERTLVVRFERDDDASHRRMSEAADVRVAWGGEEAVSAVRSLPASWNCEDLVFGPRRSFAIVEPGAADPKAVGRLAQDIVYFDQLACSSPQVIFLKASAGSEIFRRFVSHLAASVEDGASHFPRHTLDWGETYRIELDRQRAVLEGGEVLRDKLTDWTVASLDRMVGRIGCANRFVQVVPFATYEEVAAQMPENVQTMVVLAGAEASREIAEVLGSVGVCRFPRPGGGNNFEIPWDGLAVTPRLGRWVTRTTS